MSTEAIRPSDGTVLPGQAAGVWNRVRSFQDCITAYLGSGCPSGKVHIFHSSYTTSARLVCVPRLAYIIYYGAAHLCSGTWIAPRRSSAGACIQRELWPGNSGFSSLGRPTHRGRKKKIIIDYIGIAWLKCYQLCTGAGSFVTASRKGSKMPTLLVGGDPICKVQICIQTKVQGSFDQRSEYSLLQRQKTIARLDWQRASWSFQPPASHFLEYWTWIQLSRSETAHKEAAFGSTEALLGR